MTQPVQRWGQTIAISDEVIRDAMPSWEQIIEAARNAPPRVERKPSEKQVTIDNVTAADFYIQGDRDGGPLEVVCPLDGCGWSDYDVPSFSPTRDLLAVAEAHLADRHR